MKITRDIHGVILLDKPLGWSSNHAVQKIKRLYQAAKVGHTGTLDPLATGMLALCLGEATKFGQCLLEADKSYEAIVRLGQTTTTGDREGEVVANSPVPALTTTQLHQVAQHFTGVISQIPPMYSALKVNGRVLYQLARKGEVIERAARTITIHSLELTLLAADHLRLTVRCSKGTYIRTLAEDIGLCLGTGAHLRALRRTGVAHLPKEAVISFDALAALSWDVLDQHVLPVDSCVASLPLLRLNAQETQRLLWGQAVVLAIPDEPGVRRLYHEQGQFLGLAHWQESGQLLPQRLINPTLWKGLC